MFQLKRCAGTLSLAIALGCSGQALSQEAIPAVPVIPAVPQRDYLAGDYDGRRSRLYDKGIDLFANYQGEVFGNVTGGAILDSSGHSKQVAVYDGLLTFGANLYLTKLTGWWPGAKLSFSVLDMHGSNLSRLALGDLAGFSDIYGYNTIRLGEVFLEQSFF